MDGKTGGPRNRYSHSRNDFLKRTSCKRGGAGQQGATVSSTGRWRELIAPEKVVYAKDKGSSPLTVRCGTAPGSDCPQLFDRTGDGSSVSGKGRGCEADVAFAGRFGRPAAR